MLALASLALAACQGSTPAVAQPSPTPSVAPVIQLTATATAAVEEELVIAHPTILGGGFPVDGGPGGPPKGTSGI